MDFTFDEKLAIIKVLSFIMKADGIIEPGEQNFINKVYSRLGFNIDDLQMISEMDLDDCKDILSDLSQDKKDYVNKCFLEVVGVDGHVDLRELKVIHQLFS